MTLKTYSSAPLPFMGQKRKFIKQYRELLNTHIPNDGTGWTVVDAFGGSGLLSHVAKRTKPGAKVIYNDYDGYSERLLHIEDTNRLRKQLSEKLAGQPRNKALSKQAVSEVKAVINDFDGYKDVRALVTWLLFSGNEARDLDDFLSKRMYNTIRKSDYASAEDYLSGLDIVKSDFEPLLEEHQHDAKALFILDPPYVSTQQNSYANDRYFGMVEFLRLMRLVRPPFLLFSSTRSELIDYLDFIIKHQFANWNNVVGYDCINVNASVNYSVNYEDNMVYKWK